MLFSGGSGSQTINGTSSDDIIYGHSAADLSPISGVVTVTSSASGLALPTYGLAAPGDAGAMYVTEKATGVIKRVDLSTGTSVAFLSIPTTGLQTTGEQGLLSVAFHPDYATNGRFFVFVNNAAGNIEIREYTRSAGNPLEADQSSGSVVMTIPHPTFTNHNGGQLAFGPDGLLYIAVGDGGGANDVDNDAQTTTSLLGKILRIDINGDDFPADAGRNYAIPTTNVFAAGGGAGEVWALGLRNPWRMSFDTATGDLWIGDVGQNAVEEIDRIPAGTVGANLGWRILEGTRVNFPGNTTGFLPPVFEYPHPDGFSVTGGFVYHGPSPGWQGAYIFTDYVTSRIWAVVPKAGGTYEGIEITDRFVGGPVARIGSFATDAAGNLYALGLVSGQVWKLDPSAAADDGNDVLNGGAGNDQIYGGAGADRLEGSTGDDQLFGGIGNDILRGSAGVDTMTGGRGDDTFLVVDADDTVVEAASEGNDFVRSSISYTLGANVERLELLIGGLTGTGNALANTLGGSTGNDILDGGAGIDTMAGRTGDDRYFVDNVRDVVRENTGEGSDTVVASVSYTLAANVENLELAVSGLSGVGNTLVNTLTGTTGVDALNGMTGADTMIGLGGNDTYFVDAANDAVVEAAEGGIDLVNATANHTLAAEVEKLRLLGTAANGTGNTHDNAIAGNDSGNTLSGLSGTDTLDGLGGNDILRGGTGIDSLYGRGGVDRFTFDTTLDRVTNVDRIKDFVIGEDLVSLGLTIFATAGAAGTLGVDAFKNLSLGGLDTTDRILYDQTGGRLYYDADGAGGAAATIFAVVTPGLALTNTAFELF